MAIDRKRILIVDDEEVILFGFSHVLAAPGVTVDTASTSAEAEALVDEYVYSAAIVDVRLSDSRALEGLGLIPYIKSRQPRCRIIMLTAYGEEYIVRAALDAGADLFLEKPVEPESIRKKLEAMGVF